MHYRYLLLPAVLLLVHSFPASAQGDAKPNFLILIGDDMGVETLDCYGLGQEVAHTPNINRLCMDGVRFDKFWAQPVCSPTRAAMLTGQYGFRNGVGTPSAPPSVEWTHPEDTSGYTSIGPAAAGAAGAMGAGMAMGMAMGGGGTQNRPGLKPDAWTFLHALKQDESAGYATAAVGKWHLANDANGGLEHPQRVGFDHYAGSMLSGVESYYGWSKVVDGADPAGTTRYATTDTIDNSIAWLDQRGDEPWLLWVAFNSPHTPIQLPPAELLSSEASLALEPDGSSPDLHDYYNAMIEAMDTEIGRLLEHIGDEELANTYVIFMGDNGTEGDLVRPPFFVGKAKGSVYQGGINVPFMIAGPGLEAGATNAEMANVTDIFATILELAGYSAEDMRPDGVTQDTVSMVPILEGGGSQRDYNYVDRFGTTRTGEANERAIRNDRYKLIQDFARDAEELYDLAEDPYEENDLLAGELTEEQRSNHEELKQRLESLTAPG